MNSKRNSASYQNMSVQKENHYKSSNDVVHMSRYNKEVTEHPKKRNFSENPEETAESSSINIFKAGELSTLTQVFHVLLEKEYYLTQFGEGTLAKFYAHIMENTGVNLESSFVKDQGLYVTVFGNSEAVTNAENEILKWCQEKYLPLTLISKQEHCFFLDQTGDKSQDTEQEAEINAQIISPHNQSHCINTVDTNLTKMKSSDGSPSTSDRNSKSDIQILEMEKAFNPRIGKPYLQASDIFQETEEHVPFQFSSANETDVDINERKLNVDQTRCHKNDMTEKSSTITEGMMMKFQGNYTRSLKRNFLEEILETSEDSTGQSPSESISDSMTQHSEPDSSGEIFNEVDGNDDDYIVSSVFAPSWLHRFIIGKKGEKIAEISECVPKVQIHFTAKDKITLKGPIDDVNYAQEKFDIIVKDLISRMEYTEINGDSKFHKYLTGSNGEILNKIAERNQVSITMVPENELNHTIRIEGESLGVQQTKKELLDLANNLEEEYSQDIIIKHQFHHILIGQKGERVREICKKFPDVILNFPHPAEKSDIVQLIGPRYESEKCAQYLENMLTDIKENNYSISISIIKKLHKRLIGKGASNIKKISETTNTKISFPPENCNSEEFIITGYPENCEIARNWILSIQQEIADTAEEEITIPTNLYKYLNNPKECLLNSIIEECGKIHLHFPKNKSSLNKVIIMGSVESVEKAKTQLLKLAEEEQAKNYCEKIRVKSQYHQFLVNKNGGNISQICDETGACVLFPNHTNKDQESLTITGTEESVKEVQKRIEDLVKGFENEVDDSILINRRFHHYFVMRRGQLLKEMTEEYGGVAITFSYAGRQNTKVTIKCAKPCVEAAKKHIKAIFEPLGSQVTTRYVIPQNFQPFIMGPITSRIQQIARDYKVEIKFPDIEKPAINMDLATQEKGKEKWKKPAKDLCPNSPRKSDTIFISGQVENCKAATEALASIIPVTAEVHVPLHLHPYIIGNKGSGLRKLVKEFEVHMQPPQPGKNSDIISIMGLAANVEQAKMKLQKRVKALQIEIEDRTLRNFKLVFNLDPKYRAKITGHKGLLITQICTEHDVTVRFPKKGSHEVQDQITITGYKENTLAARDAIMRVLHKIEKTISKEITLNQQVRGNVFGFRGKTINKIMDQYQVDIRSPPKGSYNPNITVTGLPDNVEKAIEHILNLEKYYLSAAINHGSQQEEAKSMSLCNIAMTPPKSFVRKYVPCYAKTTTKLPDVDNCEHFPRLKQRISSKTHPSKL
ncbi:LOW QUALITY PROTEIN: vigilin-like [Rattus rattus]|uniref:LOW QUALITY PROTEIN: vigilin-like n=1 Tax=Rattus rattus TaxID=10117 RepID=UPI0013F36535|nr:LOW QUALITY PROTEIN: vigilin-like [Rattus rattus]